ncbi:hypothetical protein [Neobittarella massiliensis]|uniref:hypothetical protein n=1 Tax=Neobittarella massiliensis (ex Bilen et al. 2018) TaxID=2041842 RepID=UPI000CF6F3A2|nr:hypothetical protein [Neobittarella massiliensis]
MEDEQFDRYIADMLDDNTVLKMSGQFFHSRPPRRWWRRIAAIASCFMLVLGAANYRTVLAAAAMNSDRPSRPRAETSSWW